MLTFLTEPTDCPSSRHINVELVILDVAQSMAPDTHLSDSEKYANQLSQKAGICMSLCAGDREPGVGGQCHEGGGTETGLSRPGLILKINLGGRSNSDSQTIKQA